MNKVYHHILDLKRKKQKAFAVLVDPDDISVDYAKSMAKDAEINGVDFFFVGGSLITETKLGEIISTIKSNCNIPVVIFPGSNLHIHPQADAILFLSLISGRNPEHLIGQHVIAAPILKRSGLEVLSTGYILVDSGKQTTVSYISNTTPIPSDKPKIAACTAMAGEMLGMKLIYLDGGSGALYNISTEMIQAVNLSVNAPIIVGGGIDTIQKALDAWNAGADIVVVGNGIEKESDLMSRIALSLKTLNNN
jgi:putative glycerol-1-phosphate prenyltransferase